MHDAFSNPLGPPGNPILLSNSSFCSHLQNTSQLSIDLRTSINLKNFDSPGSDPNLSKLCSRDNISMFDNLDAMEIHDQQSPMGPSQFHSPNNPRLSTIQTLGESVELPQTQESQKVENQGPVNALMEGRIDGTNSKWYGYQRKAKRKDS